MDLVADTSEISDEINELESTKNIFYLPTGKSLSKSETYEITAKEKTNCFILIGSVGSGKTAICTSIYNMMLNGHFKEDYLFAGSKTMSSFEEYSYLTRVISNRNQPIQERTKKGSQNFLHFKLLDLQEDIFFSTLISDFSGEDFENVICNIEYAKEEFEIIKQATGLVIIIDGENLCKTSTRMSEIQHSLDLLRTFYDSDLINDLIPILIVVSKFDLIFSSNCRRNLKDLIFEKFSDQLPKLKDRLQVFEVAAMPKNNDDINSGYGIYDVFNYLTKFKCLKKKNYEMLESESQFEKWGRRIWNND